MSKPYYRLIGIFPESQLTDRFHVLSIPIPAIVKEIENGSALLSEEHDTEFWSDTLSFLRKEISNEAEWISWDTRDDVFDGKFDLGLAVLSEEIRCDIASIMDLNDVMDWDFENRKIWFTVWEHK
ncbi:hypothetical protein [Chroococcidiopsis sp.]|uniref:hypothetical protein n=1 Tax=Chroococcidiopsis sp. TaxID=3088168 RepID=UPI003F362B2C